MAIWWLRRSLELARATGVTGNIVINLGVSHNLEFLGLHEEAAQYYNEVLGMLSASHQRAKINISYRQLCTAYCTEIGRPGKRSFESGLRTILKGPTPADFAASRWNFGPT